MVSPTHEERRWFVEFQIHVGAHSIQYVCDNTKESDGARREDRTGLYKS